MLRTGPIGQTQLELVMPQGGGEYATQIYDTRVEGQIDENGLTHTPTDALMTFAGWLGVGGGQTQLSREELEARVQPDLAPDASGHFTAASAGFAIEAVAVGLVP